MVRCVVKNCKSGSRKRNKRKFGITFHTFPKNKTMRNEWIAAVNQDDTKNPSPYFKICSLHFTQDCIYETKAGVRRIKNDAVPSLFLREPPMNDTSEAVQPMEMTTPNVNQVDRYENISDDESVANNKTGADPDTCNNEPTESAENKTTLHTPNTINKAETRDRDYAQQLHEFTKFVGDQLLDFNVDEARTAQQEIRTVLAKFRKNIIIRRLGEDITSKVQTETTNKSEVTCSPKSKWIQSALNTTKQSVSLKPSEILHNVEGLARKIDPSTTQSVTEEEVSEATHSEINTTELNMSQYDLEVNTAVHFLSQQDNTVSGGSDVSSVNPPDSELTSLNMIEEPKTSQSGISSSIEMEPTMIEKPEREPEWDPDVQRTALSSDPVHPTIRNKQDSGGEM